MHAYYQLSMICDVLRLSFWTSLSLLLAFKRSRCCHVTWLFVKILLLLLYFFSTVVVDHVKDLNAVSKFSLLRLTTRLLNIIYTYTNMYLYIFLNIFWFSSLFVLFLILKYILFALHSSDAHIYLFTYLFKSSCSSLLLDLSGWI